MRCRGAGRPSTYGIKQELEDLRERRAEQEAAIAEGGRLLSTVRVDIIAEEAN